MVFSDAASTYEIRSAIKERIPGIERVDFHRREFDRSVQIRLVTRQLQSEILVSETRVLQDEGVVDTLLQGLRNLQDWAIQDFGLQNRIDEIQKEADKRVQSARGELIAELRDKLAFGLNDPTDRHTVSTALQEAAKKGQADERAGKSV